MEKIEVIGSTVDFYKEIKDGLTIYTFDTSRCAPPDPMVNAMAGLQLLDEKSKLIMINHKAPMGLLPKIKDEFDYAIEELENGNVSVVFTKKVGSENTTDFSQNSCAG